MWNRPLELARGGAPALAAMPAVLALIGGCGGEPASQPPGDANADPGVAGGAQQPPARAFSSPWLDPAELALLPLSGPDLVDETAARGLDYVNVSGAADKPTILDANGAGVAALDLGSDGDADLVFGQGVASLAALVAGPGAELAVFVNDGAGRFARAPSPPARGWWTGLAAGDVDGDGAADLVAGGYGALCLFRQDAGALVPWSDAPGGGLMDPSAPAGRWLAPGEPRAAGAAPYWTTSLAFLDAELDGDLDLYVGRYLDLDPLAPPRGELGAGPLAFPCSWKGIEVYCGPRGCTAQPDVFLRGDGAGGFTDATAIWLPDQAPAAPGFTLAVGAFDADFDGDTDLYVANDSTANLMLVNEVRSPTGAFVDRALTAGVALNPDGLAEAGMGVAFGDVDRNGRLDLAVTNFSDEPTHLYFAREMGFGDQTYKLGLQNESRRLLSWSAHLEDFDGDGRLELFTANGHVYPQADREATGTRYAQGDTLWRLWPDRPVERVWPRRRDSALALIRGTRGSAQADFDGDGAPDLVLVAIDGPATLAMNRFAPEPARAQRLVLVLEGDPRNPGANGRCSTREGLGTKAVLVPAGQAGEPGFALLKECQTAVGYQSASAPVLFFGTGALERYSSLSVVWPSGRVDELGSGAMGRRLTVREGAGIVREEKL
jgi:hypothetical protein